MLSNDQSVFGVLFLQMLRKQVYFTNISFVRFAFDTETGFSGDCGKIGVEFSSQPNPEGWFLKLLEHRNVIFPQNIGININNYYT